MAGLSRITITVLATLQETKKVVRQIEGVHEVLAVLQSARVDSVHREVVLLKMSTEYGNVKDKASRIDRGACSRTRPNTTPLLSRAMKNSHCVWPRHMCAENHRVATCVVDTMT